MESCADSIKKKENTLLEDFLFIQNCMLHGNSKPLELSWLEFFGKFGIGEKIVSQLVYYLWYTQGHLKDFSMLHVTYLLVNNIKAHYFAKVFYPDRDIFWKPAPC